MKKIKAINGYTIYQATARDTSKYNVDEGYFYLFFSSDIRDYGLSNCDWDMEAGSIEEAEAFATGTNYAIAKEIVEETTTAASFEEIQAIEQQLDSGLSREEIEEASANPYDNHEAIQAAKAYVSRLMGTQDITSLRNDAANIFANSYEDYLDIFNALEGEVA